MVDLGRDHIRLLERAASSCQFPVPISIQSGCAGEAYRRIIEPRTEYFNPKGLCEPRKWSEVLPAFHIVVCQEYLIQNSKTVVEVWKQCIPIDFDASDFLSEEVRGLC